MNSKEISKIHLLFQEVTCYSPTGHVTCLFFVFYVLSLSVYIPSSFLSLSLTLSPPLPLFGVSNPPILPARDVKSKNEHRDASFGTNPERSRRWFSDAPEPAGEPSCQCSYCYTFFLDQVTASPTNRKSTRSRIWQKRIPVVRSLEDIMVTMNK